MKTLKYSRQREAIMNYLANTKEHPTADTVYMNIRESYPNISLGTVYRNLNLLVEQGEISKFSCGDGCDRFDGNAKPHYHFVCNKCYKVYDLDMHIDSLNHINLIANAGFAGEVLGHSAIFYGNCPECKTLS